MWRRSIPGPTMRTRKRESAVEEAENPEKRRPENIHKKGEQIIVRHSGKIDAKQQSSEATVVIITASKTVTEDLQRLWTSKPGKRW
ncbi:hypothetical protein RvY_19126 [Ramazzottius varieornatus]|uniref:Uncharacterized protein n=1 Tax=Ramazzottius varieornatus TaxID=947166 RepID=A0A1D1W8B3_RAMVA|nr:hypothetical protein RvY_19126 [Ramazzottius varieornatus]